MQYDASHKDELAGIPSDPMLLVKVAPLLFFYPLLNKKKPKRPSSNSPSYGESIMYSAPGIRQSWESPLELQLPGLYSKHRSLFGFCFVLIPSAGAGNNFFVF